MTYCAYLYNVYLLRLAAVDFSILVVVQLSVDGLYRCKLKLISQR